MMSPMEVSAYLGMANIALKQAEFETDESRKLNDNIVEALATAQLYLMRMSMEYLEEQMGERK